MPQVGSQPQAGSAQQLLPCRPLSSPPRNRPQPLSQLGASQPQAASTGQAGVSQQAVSQPWPRLPIIRSNRSKPKLWVVIRQPKAKLKVKVIRLMKPRLPVAHALV